VNRFEQILIKLCTLQQDPDQLLKFLQQETSVWKMKQKVIVLKQINFKNHHEWSSLSISFVLYLHIRKAVVSVIVSTNLGGEVSRNSSEPSPWLLIINHYQ
jgi:hypothetical protein